MVRDKKDALDAIREYLLDKRGTVVLTDKQSEIFERIKLAWSLLSEKHLSRQQAATQVSKTYNISEIQGHNDVRDALNLFGEATRAQKEGLRFVTYEAIMKTFQLAYKAEDYRTMADATKNMIKVLGLDKDDPDAPDFARLEQHIYIMQIDADVKDKLMEMVRRHGTTDLNKIEDAEFIELSR